MSVRTGLTRSELLTTVAVVVLAVVGVVALWPSVPGDGVSSSTTKQGFGGTSRATAEGGGMDDAALASARAQARLAPCPTSTSGPAPSAGPLAGVRVPCLGEAGVVEPAAALAGRDALLDVWASWCAPCRAELPVLAEYAARPDAVPVLGIDVRDRPAAALALLTDLGVRLPSVADTDGALAAALRLPPAIPASYLLRADGSVVRFEPALPLRSADEVASAVSRLRRGS